MIIQGFARLIYNLISFFTADLTIPKMPSEIFTSLEHFVDYVTASMGIVAAYCDLSYVMFLFKTIISIDLTIMAYRFIMWVLKKIPFIAISD